MTSSRRICKAKTTESQNKPISVEFTEMGFCMFFHPTDCINYLVPLEVLQSGQQGLSLRCAKQRTNRRGDSRIARARSDFTQPYGDTPPVGARIARPRSGMGNAHPLRAIQFTLCCGTFCRNHILSGAEILKAVRRLTITLRTARQRFKRACISASSSTAILQAL